MPGNRTEVARGGWTTLCRLSWWLILLTLRSIRSAVCVLCSRYASYIDQHSGRRLRDVTCAFVHDDFTVRANAIKLVTREERKITRDCSLYGCIAMDFRRRGLEQDLHHTRSPSNCHTTQPTRRLPQETLTRYTLR